MVSRSAKQLTPFDRNTLLISVYESCKHRHSAVQDATALTGTIVSQLFALTESGAISRDVIAQTAHQILDRFDPAAATIYKAYHPLTTDVVKR